MNIHRRHRAGFSLVELLIVIGLMALILGIAVPAIGVFGGFARRDTGHTARDLYGMLRAAKVYAATSHVNTAVVYLIDNRFDSFSGEEVLVLDGAGIMRQIKNRAEALDLADAWIADSGSGQSPDAIADYLLNSGQLPRYMPVHTVSGQMRRFSSNSAILNALPGPDDSFRDDDPVVGLTSVSIIDPDNWFDGDGDQLPDTVSTRNRVMQDGSLNGVLDYLGSLDAFPAHLFTPTGMIAATWRQSSRERFVLEISPAPDATERFRFADAPDPADDAATLEAKRVLPVYVELFKSTGRVRIASEGM